MFDDLLYMSLQGFRLLLPGRYPQSIEMQFLTQEALWDILVRHGLDGVQPMPDVCEDKGAVYTSIEPDGRHGVCGSPCSSSAHP